MKILTHFEQMFGRQARGSLFYFNPSYICISKSFDLILSDSDTIRFWYHQILIESCFFSLHLIFSVPPNLLSWCHFLPGDWYFHQLHLLLALEVSLWLLSYRHHRMRWLTIDWVGSALQTLPITQHSRNSCAAQLGSF